MLDLAASGGPVRRVLALGAHADDIEIGCGGSLLALIRSTPGVEVAWVVFSAVDEREREARASAAEFLAGARSTDVIVHGFRDGFLPYEGSEVKHAFQALKAQVDPDLVFTHTKEDMHQDHRLVWELTWNTFRDHLVLEYEIPKYDGDLGRPNMFVPLTSALVAEKLELLERHFGSQADKRWFDADTFRGLLRLRGMEASAPERFAEAFVARKLRMTL